MKTNVTSANEIVQIGRIRLAVKNVFCLVAWTSIAAAALMAQGQPALNLAAARGFPGQTTVVQFTARQATNVVAAQFDLAHDPARGAIFLPTLAARYSNHVVRSREIAPGVRRVLVYSRVNAPLRTNGFNGRFDFAVPAQERVGSGPIVPQGVVLARADGMAVKPVSVKHGSVFVTPVYRDPDSGVVGLFFASHEDQRYLLQATDDFIHWQTVGTNIAIGDFIDWIDTTASEHPFRFYRTATTETPLGR